MTDSIYTKQTSSFWETYAKGRPPVPESYWKRIFSYHTSHGGAFDTVNDLGSGVGIHSAKLASRFQHVILTDPGPQNLEVARQRLSESINDISKDKPTQNPPQDKFSYVLGTAEENSVAASSVDMVFAANAMHFTDPPIAMPQIAAKLKPNGTLIMVVFGGFLHFTQTRVQEIWDQMCTHAIGRMRNMYKNDPATPTDRILEIQESGYDSIAIPEQYFEDVKRIRLNIAGRHEPFRMAQGEKEQYPLVSNIGAKDELIEEEDDTWAFDHDLDAIRTLWRTFPFSQLDEALMNRLWSDLENAGENGRYKGVWAVSSIMATRRTN